MGRRADLALVIARNANWFRNRLNPVPKPLALANMINTPTKRVAPNSVLHVFHPDKRPRGRGGKETLPTLAVLIPLSQALKCEVWELLHPDLQGLRVSLAGVAAYEKGKAEAVAELQE